MANVASVLKEEIARVARKELKRETSLLKKASSAYRSEIAKLKRRVLELERQVRRGPAKSTATTSSGHEAVAKGTRFSGKSLASQRRRLGLSAAECGILVGASSQSIYNWEEGKARPSVRHLPAVLALRGLGRRAANEILESRKAA